MPRIGVARDGAEPTSAEQRDRHERILDAAAHLATEFDLPRVQMTEVAKRAGVAIGTLYRYFPSKTHLFVGVMLDRLERFSGYTPVSDPDVPVQDAICDALIGMTREMVAYPSLALAMLQSNSTAVPSVVPDTVRIEVKFQEILLATAGIADPTEGDKDLLRLLSMLWFGVITAFLNDRSTTAEAEADIRRSCDLLLVELSPRSS
ncbi:TetR family transcriptional regulator [Rhodococcus artemisiae]|uniref:TetR family transcriptional regulator n=1 Tax=Rhodococcus artemisiae TaxID=714159 RepID=A0ABU7LC76_9NOCA|nr:TetR family transcriptional regulator [Rhodococcus artemisiae]MEE2058867.1 TetR family transcriptional regulator [Rhodococcus artemisiae]